MYLFDEPTANVDREHVSIVETLIRMTRANSVYAARVRRSKACACHALDGRWCEAADSNHGGQITVDEILTAVNNALDGYIQNP